ncbi:MAG TPA: hypothetical protein VNN17_07755, partial [Terriglobia bacterium]|nr:hypothetical protein [Terriglobia bacterium]
NDPAFHQVIRYPTPHRFQSCSAGKPSSCKDKNSIAQFACQETGGWQNKSIPLMAAALLADKKMRGSGVRIGTTSSDGVPGGRQTASQPQSR